MVNFALLSMRFVAAYLIWFLSTVQHTSPASFSPANWECCTGNLFSTSIQFLQRHLWVIGGFRNGILPNHSRKRPTLLVGKSKHSNRSVNFKMHPFDKALPWYMAQICYVTCYVVFTELQWILWRVCFASLAHADVSVRSTACKVQDGGSRHLENLQKL